jgi:formate hydrogenlyase subunit 4
MVAVAHIVLALAAAPLLPAVINRVKARVAGRRGPPLLQPYYDLGRLLRKGAVYSTATGWLFRASPVVGLAAAVCALLLLPFGGAQALVAFPGDLLLFAYLLALGRFLMILAALDTGSSFEGMGASREVAFASFAEPGLFLCLVALVLATGAVSLSGMLGAPLGAAWPGAAATLVLVGIALFVLLLAENSRVPVDDPATHLELTMIHEVIVLDHSGPDLALILFAGALKLALFGALVVGVFAPRAGLPSAAALALLLLGLALVAVAVGIVESVMARVRLNRVPQLLVTAGALALFAVILLLR